MVDWLHNSNHDSLVLQAIGLLLAGALVLGYAALRILDKVGV